MLRAAAAVLVAALPAAATASPGPTLFNGTTVAGAYRVLGGPLDGMFDSPLLAVTLPAADVVTFSANAKTYVVANGSSVFDTLTTPAFTGLGPGSAPSDFDACGAWLNAAWPHPNTSDSGGGGGGGITGFYHAEWACDYAHDFQTNKSIGYALSGDGGATFVKVNHPDNVIIAAANYTAAHQTGDGDHGVVQALDGAFLHLYFIEWDGYGGGATVGVARTPINATSPSSTGVPGSWTKWHNGSWSTPGVGGSDWIRGITGTAAYRHPVTGTLVSIGAWWTYDAQPWLAFSTDGLTWEQQPAPLWPVEPQASWNRSITPSYELFA